MYIHRGHMCNMHLYKYICVCVQVDMYMCECVCVGRHTEKLVWNVHVHLCLVTCRHVCVCACGLECTRIFVCLHVDMYVCVRVARKTHL